MAGRKKEEEIWSVIAELQIGTHTHNNREERECERNRIIYKRRKSMKTNGKPRKAQVREGIVLFIVNPNSHTFIKHAFEKEKERMV